MPEQQQVNPLVQILALVNRLQLKAFNAPNKETLGFIIVNDSHQVFKYDRALLWEMDDKVPHLVAISGQHSLNKETELYQKSTRLFKSLGNFEVPQQLTADSFTADQELWKDIFPKSETSLIYWIPIKVENELKLGLVLEIWDVKEHRNPQEELNFLLSTLTPAYATAWGKFEKSKLFRSRANRRKLWYYLGITGLVLLFAVRIPLRVASSAEIVAKNPLVVAAPLDGIIEKVMVKPGQEVTQDELLFVYDKRVPLQELNAARKQVEISEAERDRAGTLGLSDPKSLTELEVLQLKLEKDQISRDLAESQVEKLDVWAPESGIVMINDPEEWQGKPVKVGEKVLTISNPGETKIRIWVPEGDNVTIDQEQPVVLILNVSPDKEYHAKLDFISFESQVVEGGVPAFLAEANWQGEEPKEIKLGLKGTAILYGEHVSLFYFLFRKPWSSFRQLTGL